jgi:RNA polymerase sigma-70 factor (ECF subfamily)
VSAADPQRARQAEAIPADLAKFRPAMLAYFRKRAHPADVEDLVQEVFLNVHARQTEAPIENIEGYLFAVALNALVRKGRRDRAAALGQDSDPASLLGPEPISPERALLGKERLAGAIRIMEGMPLRTQEIFLLHRFDEMTYPAIAAALGISVSAVEKHIMTALRLLADGLGGRR